MAIAASATDSQIFPYAPGDVFNSAILVLMQNGWEVRFSDPQLGRISARAPMSLKASGENVLLQIAPSGTGTEVRIESSSSAQVVDWGKNKQNVEKVIVGLAAHLRAAAKPTSAPVPGNVPAPNTQGENPRPNFCPSCGATAPSTGKFCSNCGKALA